MKDALEADGVDVVWVNGGADVDGAVVPRNHEYLDDADVVVADLTESNPNIMYEMGSAHALRKRVMPVVERRLEAVPPAVRGRLFFVYDEDRPDKLVTFLGRWMDRYRSDSTALQIEEPVG